MLFFNGKMMRTIAEDDNSGGGAGGREWVETLPEPMREWDEVKNSETVEDFTKQIVDLRSHLGNSIRIPGEDAGEEDKKVFLEKLQKHVPDLMPTPNLDDPEATLAVLRAMGLPENVEDYKMPELDTQGLEMDQERINAMLPIFHKLGLTQRQVNGLIEAVTDADVTNILTAEKSRKDGLTELAEDWGIRFDRRKDLVLSLANKTQAPEGLIDAIKTDKADADTLRWLHGLTKQLSADGQEIINQQSNSGGVTPEEARNQIDETMGNKSHPYWRSGHPRHEAAVNKMLKLREIAGA